MVVIYNYQRYADTKCFNCKPFTEADYYYIMKKHGLAVSSCFWIVPGTIEDQQNVLVFQSQTCNMGYQE